MTTPVASRDEVVARILATPRPGEETILAFYEHRLGVICTDPRLMLMPMDDHLVHRGDGVFETLRFEDGCIYQLDAHLARLERSCAAIGLVPPEPLTVVRGRILDVCRAAGEPCGHVFVLVGRGPGGFSLDPRECPRASLYVVVRRFTPKPERFWEEGVHAWRVSIPPKPSWLAGIKSVNYLPNVLMKMEAVAHGAEYPLCFDEDGNLAEGATENVALVDAAGHLVIPELKHALLGTTLKRVMTLVEGQMPVVVRPVPEAELFSAREVLLLGTSIDAVAVVRYNDTPVGGGAPGPVAQRLRTLLQADRRAHATPLHCPS
ncbi:aminotransferase [Thermodesulfomicrobium sp. WS]|uniref:aminotransferase class IV n=1 Tax=Thermodesulfomicrobium sp. WS TaxID=3004129 RepID=UPI00249294DD|nr:aminotransferase class IV [Thermodesulfomicrobium sp. WS]BDV00006.1 aminotransferase [Thermodesulfomicrobium sp. WS]